VCILLRGDTYTNTAALLALLGTPLGSESFFYQNILPQVAEAVNGITKEFLEHNQAQIQDRNNVHIILDAGWNHPGWWARECTVIGIDAKTGLPIAIKHILKDRNYTGSSRGK
jgi:hypothetical protein